jgi:hypothetical protein
LRATSEISGLSAAIDRIRTNERSAAGCTGPSVELGDVRGGVDETHKGPAF